MTVKPLHNEHRLVRHVKKRQLARDPNDDSIVLGFLADAFRLRANDTSLSAAWPEFYAGGPEAQVRAAIDHFKSVMSVRPNDRFAVGEVGVIKSACASFGLAVRIVHEPVAGHDAHAAVRRFKDDNSELLDLLASDAWAEMALP